MQLRQLLSCSTSLSVPGSCLNQHFYPLCFYPLGWTSTLKSSCRVWHSPVNHTWNRNQTGQRTPQKIKKSHLLLQTQTPPPPAPPPPPPPRLPCGSVHISARLGGENPYSYRRLKTKQNKKGNCLRAEGGLHRVCVVTQRWRRDGRSCRIKASLETSQRVCDRPAPAEGEEGTSVLNVERGQQAKQRSPRAGGGWGGTYRAGDTEGYVIRAGLRWV